LIEGFENVPDGIETARRAPRPGLKGSELAAFDLRAQAGDETSTDKFAAGGLDPTVDFLEVARQ